MLSYHRVNNKIKTRYIIIKFHSDCVGHHPHPRNSYRKRKLLLRLVELVRGGVRYSVPLAWFLAVLVPREPQVHDGVRRLRRRPLLPQEHLQTKHRRWSWQLPGNSFFHILHRYLHNVRQYFIYYIYKFSI